MYGAHEPIRTFRKVDISHVCILLWVGRQCHGEEEVGLFIAQIDLPLLCFGALVHAVCVNFVKWLLIIKLSVKAMDKTYLCAFARP